MHTVSPAIPLPQTLPPGSSVGLSSEARSHHAIQGYCYSNIVRQSDADKGICRRRPRASVPIYDRYAAAMARIGTAHLGLKDAMTS
jgi:hypothetical protein